jgi:uridine kinase
MKTIEQIAKKVNIELKRWARRHKRFIVVIDGYAGSGKTSIADRIAELNPDCLIVHLDDFIKHWKTRKQMMDTAHDRSKVFEYKWYRYDTLERLVKAFLGGRRKYIHLKLYDFDNNEFTTPQVFGLSKNILVIERIFLLHPRHKRNTLWTRGVFLKVDIEKAEERRVSREKRRWGEAYLPEDHPDSYIRDFRIAYKRYLDLYKPEQRADLVIDVD